MYSVSIKNSIVCNFCCDLLGHHFSALYGVCVPDNLDSLLRILEVIQVDPDDVVPVLGIAVRLGGLLVPTVSFLGLGILDVNLGGGDVGQQVTDL